MVTKAKLNIKQLGKTSEPIRIVWLHGWGQDHNAFMPIASVFSDMAENYLINLPGFGGSERPHEVWGVTEYAQCILDWLNKQKQKPTYIVGHSLGGRIAIKMAYLEPNQISGLVLISSAGLRIKKSLNTKVKILISKIGSPVFKKIERFLPHKLSNYLRKIIGSKDYMNSNGIMREILKKTVNEDLSKIARKVKTKTLLIYGSQDSETPPVIGKKFNKLLLNSEFIEIKGYDHYSILTSGRYQVQNLIKKFIS